MEAVVNNKSKYILFYSAKAGCTSLRSLYLDLHKEEMSPNELEQLNGYHNLHEVHEFDVNQNYSGFYKFLITRNPYTRIVSAFLDQYVYARNEVMQAMLDDFPATDGEPTNFLEFLQYLKKVPDESRDPHFQTQAYFFYDAYFPKRRNIFKRGRMATKLNYRGDISELNQHLQKVYRKVFKKDSRLFDLAMSKTAALQKMNSSFYDKESYENAALLDIQELDQMIYPPKPQDFYASSEVRDLIADIYADDFRMFNYSLKEIPLKRAASELDVVPRDFDWQTYLLISPDLQLANIVSERAVTRHYLEFGRHESQRSYKLEAPVGFEWRRYLEINRGRVPDEIDNERDALIHYLGYGQRQGLYF